MKTIKMELNSGRPWYKHYIITIWPWLLHEHESLSISFKPSKYSTMNKEIKDNVFRRLIFTDFGGRHCGGHLSLSAYKFHYPAPALPDFYTGALGRDVSSREMSFCSEQLHLVIYNTLVRMHPDLASTKRALDQSASLARELPLFYSPQYYIFYSIKWIQYATFLVSEVGS